MKVGVSSLTKVYGIQKAIDDISFEIKGGEIVGFLGPNGAGKSTTMKIMTCYINPTSGNVYLNDKNINDDGMSVRSHIGYLPEHNPLYLDMSVVDYLHYAARLYKLSHKQVRPRIIEMLSVCGLEPEMHKNIGELSKGYRQRVGLAQAMIHDPDVLILDEPTTGLDPNQIVEIRHLIRRIGQEKTVMLSSHILKEVEATCDRIIIINKGKIVADSPTSELQRMARGSVQYRVKIKTEQEQNDIKKELIALDDVSDAKVSQQDNTTWLVDSKSRDKVAEDIFLLCVKHNWILSELSPVESTLEDIFRSLTAN